MIIWKDVVGYEGYYEVSNTGLVRSVDKTITDKNGKTKNLKGKVLAGGIMGHGYLGVSLWKDNKGLSRNIHTLVAQAFLTKPSGQNLTINHIDGNKLNNCAGNLEWVSHRANMLHAKENKLFRYGKNHPKGKLSEDDITLLRKWYSMGVKRETLSLVFPVSKYYIYQILKNNVRRTDKMVC